MKFEEKEHITNLKHLRNHISEVGSIQNRKKNPMNPFLYPVYVFRKSKDQSLKATPKPIPNINLKIRSISSTRSRLKPRRNALTENNRCNTTLPKISKTEQISKAEVVSSDESQDDTIDLTP